MRDVGFWPRGSVQPQPILCRGYGVAETPWSGFPGNINSSLLGGNNTDTGVNNIQYTAQFGNGVSALIGLDAPTVWNRTAVYNLGIPSAISANGAGIERLSRHAFA
jgi:hypothetical protein